MRHDHPRGRPITNGVSWCKACVIKGISTADEAAYEPLPRGDIQVGMTVEWMQYTGQDGKGKHLWVHMTGQVWALTELTWTREWWVVDNEQKVYRVRQDSMKILSKEKADARLVS